MTGGAVTAHGCIDLLGVGGQLQYLKSAMIFLPLLVNFIHYKLFYMFYTFKIHFNMFDIYRTTFLGAEFRPFPARSPQHNLTIPSPLRPCFCLVLFVWLLFVLLFVCLLPPACLVALVVGCCCCPSCCCWLGPSGSPLYLRKFNLLLGAWIPNGTVMDFLLLYTNDIYI